MCRELFYDELCKQGVEKCIAAVESDYDDFLAKVPRH